MQGLEAYFRPFLSYRKISVWGRFAPPPQTEHRSDGESERLWLFLLLTVAAVFVFYGIDIIQIKKCLSELTS